MNVKKAPRALVTLLMVLIEKKEKENLKMKLFVILNVVIQDVISLMVLIIHLINMSKLNIQNFGKKLNIQI